MAPAMRAFSALLVVALLVPVAAWTPDAARADGAFAHGALPSPRAHHAVVFDGTHFYSFGGSGASTEIVRYDPASNVATVVRTDLLFPGQTTRGVRDAAAAYVDGAAYLFGGTCADCPSTQTSNRVHRYEPATNTLTLLPGTLPFPVHTASAATDGTHVYLFGGERPCFPCRSPDVVRFDPVTGASSVVAAMPEGRSGPLAFESGGSLYVVGGHDGSFNPHASILRFDPATSAVTTLASSLPAMVSAIASDGVRAYVFAGSSGGCCYNGQIRRFTPSTGAVETMTASLPQPLQSAAAGYDGTYYYVLGGNSNFDTASIVRYTLEPGAPLMRGAAASGVGEIRVEWDPPSPSSYGPPLSEIRLFRSVQSASQAILGPPGTYTLLASLPGSATSHVDAACPAGSLCFYRAMAVNAHGEGPMAGAVWAPGTRVET